MNLKLTLIIGFSYLYGFFEVFMNLRQRRNRKTASSGDKGSLWFLYGMITLGYLLSFSLAATKYGRVYHWNTLFALGFSCALLGLAIRLYAIFTLKQHFTYSVQKIQGHQIIETGLYRVIRHPGYLGQILLFTGISVSLSNWGSIILMTTPVLVGYAYRIHVEEEFMAEQMGESYSAYRSRTGRLIPKLY